MLLGTSLNYPYHKHMLKTKNNNIINSEAKEVFLRGVNLGGWLMMEGYILHGRNIAERIFKAEFKKRWGQKDLATTNRKNRKFRGNDREGRKEN